MQNKRGSTTIPTKNVVREAGSNNNNISMLDDSSYDLNERESFDYRLTGSMEGHSNVNSSMERYVAVPQPV